MDKYLSVITNFGCHYKCPYCVVKNNNLHIPKTTVEGLDKLSEMIDKYECNWVSVSGGGDPLFKVTEHIDWFDAFFKICKEKGVKTELHTSLITTSEIQHMLYPQHDFDRIVYHCHTVEDLFRIGPWIDQIVRVVFVVTEDFTPEAIDTITTIAKNSPYIDELSFRQMIDSNYQTTHYCEDYLRAGHKKDWWYIEQCDYNIYYAENEVKFKYEDFKEG
jgi:organic radical activating enzyme